MLIYKVTNKINGKEYVGQTTQSLKERKRKHISKALNKGDIFYFHHALRKYGPENFSWEIIHDNIDNIDELNEFEIYYICYYNSFEKGYNLTLGGKSNAGFRHSEEAKKRISETLKGKHHSEETKRKISVANTGKAPWLGKHHSKETRRKMSEINKGKRLSKETRKRISESCKGRFAGKNSPVAKAVIINTNYFDTMNEAAKAMNVTRLTIYRRIKRQVLGYKYAQI